jgi:N-acetylglucosaminyldiphosphoundecaprenol N-acetyl-beta-D-mannosaminyltransferase
MNVIFFCSGLRGGGKTSVNGYISCKNANLSVFLLGDEEGVARKSADVMTENHPGLTIAGSHHGYFNTQNSENEIVIDYINSTSSDILLVGMGMPRQEFWVDDNIDKLNVRVCITVGAAFRWYSGLERRAPRWVTDNGFEWLGRLVHHPIKLFRRYVIGNPLLMLRVITVYWLKLKMPSKCKKHVIPGCRIACKFQDR